ncbi:MAG: protoporphyrinogen oxidase [Verrucomicrobia bacterium A1]|nr:MAG: protoporphyrinogen oxidase [Verrucomicrobia bacterium A1]
MTRIAVIGGGIAGLAAAYAAGRRAREAGRPVEIALFERDARLGGKILTQRAGGFIVEGGPDSFINQKPHGLQLFRELGLGGELMPSNDATYKTRLLRKGRLLAYPEGFRLAVPTKIWPFVTSPLISPLGKLRMGLDLFLPARTSTADESLADFITRRLGREALDRIAGPIMSGIFVADPEKMSVQSTFPMFVELERKYGSLTRGIRIARKKAAAHGTGATSSVFTGLRPGMDALVVALASRIGADARTGTAVRALRRTTGGFELTLDPGGAFAADRVILAAPAYASADLVAEIHPTLAAALRGIRYVSSATVSMSFRREDAAECPDGGGFGFVVPRTEPAQLLAFTWSSRKFDGRAPEGRHLVRAFIGGSRHEELAGLPEDELVRITRGEIGRILRLRAEPESVWVSQWPKGNPQFDVGHLDRVGEMERMAAEIPGLHLAGSAYRGVGIPDCIKSARAAVDAVFEA